MNTSFSVWLSPEDPRRRRVTVRSCSSSPRPLTGWVEGKRWSCTTLEPRSLLCVAAVSPCNTVSEPGVVWRFVSSGSPVRCGVVGSTPALLWCVCFCFFVVVVVYPAGRRAAKTRQRFVEERLQTLSPFPKAHIGRLLCSYPWDTAEFMIRNDSIQLIYNRDVIRVLKKIRKGEKKKTRELRDGIEDGSHWGHVSSRITLTVHMPAVIHTSSPLRIPAWMMIKRER